MIGYNKSEIVGKMRERVILQNRIITQSDSGFQSEIYNDIGIYWSKIEYKTGFEEEDADKITNQQKINITLRYNILVNVNSRFVYRNELYQVEKVEYSDDRRFMTCVCVWRSSYTSIYAGSIFCSASLLAQSSLSAALMRVIKYQASLNAFGSVSADIALVQKVASSLNAFGTLTGDINFVQKLQASLLTSSSVTGNISIPKLVQASLTGAGTTAADLTVTAAASLLLDLYPSAAAAYSLRKLRSAYTGSAIRVRRSSDNTEQNIGFTGNELDTTALLSFCGAGNGFVTTWYDQSGNARNATQTTQSAQPQIVSSGSLITRNSRPYIQATQSMTLVFNELNAAINTNYSFWLTYEKDRTGNQAIILRDADNYHWLDYSTIQAVTGSDNITITSIYNINTLYLTNVITNYSVGATHYRNGASIGTRGALTKSAISNMIPSNIFRTAIITFSEFIYYSSNQSANRTGIETNINTHYGIY